MTQEIVEKYLTEKCGITKGPWEVTRLLGKQGKGLSCGIMVTNGKKGITGCGIIAENARVLSASFSMLRDWILTAWELFFRTTGNGFEGVEFDIFQRAIKNIETALNKPWAEVRKELEKMV